MKYIQLYDKGLTMKEKLLTHFDLLVAFVKLSLSDGLVKTAKEDKRSAGIIVGIIVLFVLILSMASGGDNANDNSDTYSASSSNKLDLLESDSMDLDKPLGVFSYKGLVGEKQYFDLSESRLKSFFIDDNRRIGNFTVEVDRIIEITLPNLSKVRDTGMPSAKGGITFHYKDPLNGGHWSVNIIRVKDQKGERYVMLRHQRGKDIRESIVNNLTYY